MRKAFTLIELLVVIAIIAILAAILFPVFAQAKAAAKKSAALSNAKQIGLGIIMYTADYDDIYPRNDDCVLNSSLNPVLNNGTLRCSGAPGFGHRMNHFSWQKWPMPYIKNIQILEHPMRQKDATQWNTNGQLIGGFTLNGSITGSLDTWNRAPTFLRQFRDSFRGGTVTSIPSPAETFIIGEFPFSGTAFIPGGSVDVGTIGTAVTVYPPATREFWRYRLMKGTTADCVANTSGTEPDSSKIPSGGMTLAFCDGSAKFLPANKFLAMTPTKAQYLGGANITFPAGVECQVTTTGNLGFGGTPNVDTINFPLWGLGQ